MSGGRGRPRKVLPIHPNLVLTRSLKTALSTTVYLQRALKNKKTAHLYESSRNILKRAQKKYLRSKNRGHPDFDRLTKAENNIRKNSLQMLFEYTALYGNKEVRRVKSSDKSVGPLNQRFNVGGAVLRDFGMTTFPFPDRERLYGFTEEIYGYSGNSLCHKVVPFHSLPELDFIDVCRKHIQILNTWCYIFDVSLTDTAKYSNLFLLQARPYLERIYSENKYGKAGFREGTLKILRNLKNDIARNYRVRTVDAPTVTSAIDHKQPTLSIEFFKEQVREVRERGIVSSSLFELERILSSGSIINTVLDEDTLEEKAAPCLTDDDVKYFWQRIFELSGQKGTQVHRQITTLFPSHWNISRVIKFGDELGGEDGYLLCSEIPIDTILGRGRIDLVLHRRVITPDGLNTFWKPVFIIDIKTRQGYSWDLGYETKESASRKQHNLPLRKVPEFIISERMLNDDEWRNILEGNPDDAIVKQVDAYAKAVSNEFMQISQSDEPVRILKGILIIDAGDDIREIRSAVRSFVIEVFESIKEFDVEIPRTLFNATIDMKTPRVAMILHEQNNPFTFEEISVPAPTVQVRDPFEFSIDRSNEFILYLACETQTSGGTSAAWIAKYFHGLQLINDWRKRNSSSKTLWIDLADEFIQPGFREARLHLRSRSGNFRDRARSQSDSIRTMFDSIELVGLLDEVLDFLFMNGDTPIINSKNIPDLVVVSGWDRLHSSIPSHLDERFRELKAKLVSQVSENFDASILWFDNPIPEEQNSSVYSTRTMIPYYQNSPFFGRVTQIIWNLPVAPESEILSEKWTLPYTASSPLFDDIRVITRQKQSGFNTELVSVPPLVGWSRRFRSDFKESELDTLLEEAIPPTDIRERIKIFSFDLIPWLLELWPNSKDTRLTRKSLLKLKEKYRVARNQIEVHHEKLPAKRQDVSLLKRVKFRPQSLKSGTSYVSVAMGTINSHRYYRSSYKIKTQERSSYEKTEMDELGPAEKLLFARIYTRYSSETQDELLVIENPKDSTKLLVGYFSEASRKDSSGFLWCETNKDRLLMMVDDFDSLEVDSLLLRVDKNQLELWRWDHDREDWLPRSIIEIHSRNLGSIGLISGIREIPFESDRGISTLIDIPESINQFVKQSLIYLVNMRRLPKEVKISILREKSYCNILFLDTDDVELHKLKVQSTPDLIDVLRWPLTNQRPHRIDGGNLIVWNPFTNIDYGEFESVRPYVETTAPRDVGKPLPQTINDLMKSKDERKIQVVLSHDITSCPLIQGTGVAHTSCWTITSEEEISKILPDRTITGKEVYGYLSTGTLDSGLERFNIEMSMAYSQGSREFYVYHEDSWIRRLLREQGIYVKKLKAGSFLQSNEQWRVILSIKEDYIEWMGLSTITGYRWKDRDFKIRLNYSVNLEQAMNEIRSRINEEIDIINILNSEEIEDQLESLLSELGYGEERPLCRLQVSRNGTTISIQLLSISHTTVMTNTFNVEDHEDSENVLNGLYNELAEGELSRYRIENQSEFFETLENLLNEI